MREQRVILSTSRAVQAERGDRSLISRLPPRYNIFSLGQEESGERSLIDGLPGYFRQTNTSRRGIEETTEISVTDESSMNKIFIFEQEASGERSERSGADPI